MNMGHRGRKRLERSRDFHIWKVQGGALRGLICLTYDGVVYFYFRYPWRGVGVGSSDRVTSEFQTSCVLLSANSLLTSSATDFHPAAHCSSSP